MVVMDVMGYPVIDVTRAVISIDADNGAIHHIHHNHHNLQNKGIGRGAKTSETGE